MGGYTGGLRRADWTVVSERGRPGEGGVRVAVREVRGASCGRPPVILVHGARVPGIGSFDLPVEGGSLAGDLARAGHAVFVMDARGYGGSTRPAEMDEPPADNPPLATGDQIIRDIGAVVDRVRQRTGRGQVALAGWATGGHWAGWYASRQPDKISHLVVYNSLYGAVDGHPALGRGGQYEDPDNPGEFDADRVGAYRFSTGESLLPQWDAGIPVEDKSEWRDPRVARAFVDMALASDPTSSQRDPASFRAPTGALADSFALATGRRLWHAGTITAKTLVVRSENDFWSRADDVRTLAAELRRAERVRTVQLDQATHYVHLDRAEKGRGRLLAEFVNWLGN
ncbi:alpha/beta fold hydrolase [Actinomadura alba]|uniref:Alpha/beta fold hydrolase n=2 Tax=Actinomadura alba TaxID=406431 RepID=A0ABR7LM44_9ACTN|nr:alpha/beta fold hydrolase [Actinomadura alba]